MASYNVIILTPNGRRQNVKATPNMTILQILETVCKKHGFKVDEHDLKHHNKVLDVSSILRFSGLPNNAQLEMCPIVKARKESPVQLLLQLEDGSRLVGTFASTDTLWFIMNELCPDRIKVEEHPVLIYMRQELYGLEKFQATTLKSLGLTDGRAMMRLIHKSPEELQKQACVWSAIPSKRVEEQPLARNTPGPGTSQQGQPQPSTSKGEPRCSPPAPKRNFLTEFIKAEKVKSASKPRTPSPRRDEPMEVDQAISAPRPAPEEEPVFLGERNALVFSLDISGSVPHEDLPDEFFELTIQDARQLLRDLKQRRMEMEERPLMTSALKNLEEEKRRLRQLHQYKRSVIRVQFPDRMVLQGTFKPTETVATVMHFVRDYLEDASQEFHLYTTPPKVVLEPSSTLLHANCVPSAVVHFSFNSVADAACSYLKQSLLSKITSHSVASLAAARSRIDKVRRSDSDGDEGSWDLPKQPMIVPSVQEPSASGAGFSQAPTTQPTTTAEQHKIPKWFKPQ